MLSSLRARLIASYAFVVFISLFLAGSGFLWLGQQYQMQREMQRLADIVLPLSAHVRYLELMGTPTADIAAFLDDQAQHLNVRLLLVRTGDRVVAADTSDELQGYVLPPDEDTPAEQAGRLQVGRYQAAGGQVVTISVAGALQVGRLSDRLPPRFAPRLAVMVAVPQASLAAAWLALAPRLLIAGVLALFASLPVALWLTRSITRPVGRITRASEEMARGHYEQTIPVEGQDEISRLASAFNLMAKQVALSHSTLREFLADVSHELRTPLTSIRGFSQAMTDGALHTPAEYAEAGQVIHEEAERMSRLVESLLHLSRVESGQFGGQHHPLDLAALVAACVGRAERRAAGADVALTIEAQPAPPVLGETHRLEEVVDNLLDNAIKHTPAGGRITVRLARGTPPATKGTSDASQPLGARLAVHNTGSLIPAEALPRVFDRFYRGTPAQGDGHGLGLAIARQIVEAHHGRISVTSTAEHGTEFTVWLPAAPALAAANGHVRRSREPTDSGASARSVA
ncbi:MAG TPA: ATP-binding protein [Chloroflexota bacterium]|nr:ATP-binding protein [Chloroflexota bacterium]